ncbi:MAG TPA: cupredoxin domain-containing protein [Vicinamibacteria bacterium]|nr:cupredoxin domain-containing protein [Vicinamibacteria bacterium]
MVRGAGRRAGLQGAAFLFAWASGSVLASSDGVELVVSRAGFRPHTVNARKGDNLRLVLSTADEEHCFALDAYRVEKRVVPGKTTTVELALDRSGSFPFYCCLEPGNQSLRGKLVVAE